MDTSDTLPMVEALAAALLRRGWKLVAAESCTGGLVAAACTELAGSSNWFDRGFVTYSNEAKTDLLGVPASLIDAHGAVSEAVVRAMAHGALARSQANVAVAISGIAGPTGGSPAKPVGSVWMAWAWPGRDDSSPMVHAELKVFDGTRAQVRTAAVKHVLAVLLARSGEGQVD